MEERDFIFENRDVSNTCIYWVPFSSSISRFQAMNCLKSGSLVLIISSLTREVDLVLRAGAGATFDSFDNDSSNPSAAFRRVSKSVTSSNNSFLIH